MKRAALAAAALALTGCGTHADLTAFPPHYGETKACLDALNAAQAYIQGVGITATKTSLETIVDDAFRAGATHDLKAGAEALHQLDHATRTSDTQAARLVHEFATAAAGCRNPSPATGKATP